MTTVTIPVIETERLILRGQRAEDLPAYSAYFQTPRADWTGGQRNEVEAMRTLMTMAGHWQIRGYGIWVIEHRDTGKTAGWAGILHHLDWPEPELGWTVFDGFEGQGIAYEAAHAARAVAATKLGVTAPISLIRPQNERSAALATRLEAVIETQIDFHDAPIDIWRHPDVSEVVA
ncbi:hypothetical protein ATO6_01360 [Oceanicola sp. 22II-s10i]|uniref:GNAT family N-acetyltransferase n=1 Tax=Oceanicola sp. 22II-s10i TaxID=1317116 RepID=UPI000B521970|nr:GNAT family N-acetyltransferase [Oceanicola sp. 22II-s10i]OWU85607.1 hypothetical protein ATO6_01360 [Oceanicola sp. 22II-s10i]